MKRRRKRELSSLGEFHKAATAKGLTYAEAQMQETCKMVGRIRTPKGELPDGRIYSKISEKIRKGN